jgi:hypothetical protein
VSWGGLFSWYHCYFSSVYLNFEIEGRVHNNDVIRDLQVKLTPSISEMEKLPNWRFIIAEGVYKPPRNSFFRFLIKKRTYLPSQPPNKRNFLQHAMKIHIRCFAAKMDHR